MEEAVTSTVNLKADFNQEDLRYLNVLHDMILRFVVWLEQVGYESYDPYDIWGTRYGKWARRLYYDKHPLGTILTAPFILMEMVHPSLRSLFVKKDRFATADAHLVLAFLNVREINHLLGGWKDGFIGKNDVQEQSTKSFRRQAKTTEQLRNNAALTSMSNSQFSNSLLLKAEQLAEDLLLCSIPNYSGHCWGYPFDWQSVNGLISKNTPHITATPYCYEAFCRLFETTGQSRYLEIARSAAAFVFNDLNDTPIGKDAAAASYTPFDYGKVVNANAYRAFVLFDAAHRFNIEQYREKAWKNLRFILHSQNEDGSWLYAVDSPGQAFIDHFHTCFVLKNLYKLNCYIMSGEVTKAIRNGFLYYREALYDKDDNPRLYSVPPRMQIVRLEMYNFAEAISLGALLKTEIPEAFVLACKLALRLADNYQLQDGYFVTRTYLAGFKHRLPFLRWPQAQLFFAITNLLSSIIKSYAKS